MKKTMVPVLILFSIMLGFLTGCISHAPEPLIFSAIDPQTPTQYPGYVRHSEADLVWATQILDKDLKAINARDADGNTPLTRWIMSIATKPDCRVGKFLITKGADVNARNKKGETALMIVAGMNFGGPGGNKLNKINFLINNGAKVNLRNKRGETALTYAQVKCRQKLQQLARAQVDSKLMRQLEDECTQAIATIGRAGGVR